MRYAVWLSSLLAAPLLVACNQSHLFGLGQSSAPTATAVPDVSAVSATGSQATEVLPASPETVAPVAVVPPADEVVVATARVERLSAEEYLISQVQLGNFPCNNNIHVNVSADPVDPRLFRVEGKGFSHRMKPVTTKSGAVRLEDEAGGIVWLQVATKSMLMNQVAGTRLADACVSPRQLARAEELGLTVEPPAPPAPVAKKAVTAKK